MLRATCKGACSVHLEAKFVNARLLSTTPVLSRAKTKKPRRSRSQSYSPFKAKRPTLDSRLSNVKPAARAETIGQGQDHDPQARLILNIDKKYTGRHAVFQSTVIHRLQYVLQKQYESAQFVKGIASKDDLCSQGAQFMDVIDQAFALADTGVTQKNMNPLFWNFRDAFVQKDLKGLQKEIQYSFQSFINQQRFSKGVQESQSHILDFTHPEEWFPATRSMQRVIHVHVGPTNSGKTYNAIKALENSTSGVYAGPLRLLASEIYHRFRAKGIPCALITGEELRIPEDTDRYFSSCTVEMVPLNKKFDVAVIDEIQMIGNTDRGNAWLTAFLGVQAKEVHVCGEERTVALIEALCATTRDKCVIHRYKRLTPLKTMDTALRNNFALLEKGDAVVAFSRVSLHALKRQIEQSTGRRCAIIYGSLPPEVRVQQADLFNNPDNDYDFVVASDAIGMGLNLEIRRTIFESVFKFDGTEHRVLEDSELKQIGGRAGRYRSASAPNGAAGSETEKVGYVTCMDQADIRTIKKAFAGRSPDIQHAFIEPPPGIVERFASYFPADTPLSFILMRMKAAATISPHYRISICTAIIDIADIIQEFPLSISDRLTICHMPIPTTNPNSVSVIRAVARIIANNEAGDLLSIPEIKLEVLDKGLTHIKSQGAITYLHSLETLHISLNCYIWLSYRFTGMFRDQELAFHVRSLVEQKLTDSLSKLNFTGEELKSRRNLKRRQAASKSLRDSIALEAKGDETSPLHQEKREAAAAAAA